MMAERDPFELLPGFIDPEPDPVVMKATIAQSREAFLRRKGRAAGGHAGAWWARPWHSANWLVPAGAGALALLAAVVVAPNLAQRSPVDQQMQREPAIATGPEQAGANGSVRMGMQSAPAPTIRESGTSLARERVAVFEGSNVRVETRATSYALELYLPDIAQGRMIDSQGLLAEESAAVVAAFQIAESNIVAIRLDTDGVVFWRAYRAVDGVYARDAALSALISDARDEAEARRRLAEP